MRIRLSNLMWYRLDQDAQAMLDYVHELSKHVAPAELVRGNTRSNPTRKMVSNFFEDWKARGFIGNAEPLACSFWICFTDGTKWNRFAHDINKREK